MSVRSSTTQASRSRPASRTVPRFVRSTDRSHRMRSSSAMVTRSTTAGSPATLRGRPVHSRVKTTRAVCGTKSESSAENRTPISGSGPTSTSRSAARSFSVPYSVVLFITARYRGPMRPPPPTRERSQVRKRELPRRKARQFSSIVYVELRGLEPLTPTLPVWCATSCAIAPYPFLRVRGQPRALKESYTIALAANKSPGRRRNGGRRPDGASHRTHVTAV